MKIWKVSHGNKFFTQQELEKVENQKIAVVHSETRSKGQSYTTQGENYILDERQFDIFYSCHSNNSIRHLGIFLDKEVSEYDGDDEGWKSRKYELIAVAKENSGYSGNGRWWKPNDNSTFTEVPENLYSEFEKDILLPFFNINLKNIFSKRIGIIQQIQNQQYMQKYITLLEANKNIILTGAPGTGKTYLAKEIAKELIKSKQIIRPLDKLKIEINRFQPNVEDRKAKVDLLQKFLNLFPIENLSNLTLDKYCVGRGTQDSFCWWLETGLQSLGSYAPAQRGSFVFGIFFNKESNEYKKRPSMEKWENDIALKNILQLISDILSKSDKEDIFNQALQHSIGLDYIDKGFLLKILTSYKAKEFIPIHSSTHLKYYAKLFNLNVENDSNIFILNQALYQLYQQLSLNIDITTQEFMRLLYTHFPVGDAKINFNSESIILLGDYAFVQFHPSYDYTDFVEGLRPVKKDGKELGFELKNGIFKAFCKKALVAYKEDIDNSKEEKRKFVFIIDEINRAEISKVFGELFFSIDPGYRGKEGSVNTQYANIQEGDTIFDEDLEDGEFYVPENVYIIGTMNDIDHSVESFDFAMRRRFAWIEITAEERREMWDGQIDDMKQEAGKKMTAINQILDGIEGLGASFHIGPAYFLNLENYKGDFSQLWKNHIEVLLKEYLRGMPDAETNLKNLQKAYDDNN